MGGFFRLFAIMAAMPGEDVPRQALADFLGVWSRIWDSSVGSHQQKIEAMERFYDENASTLGDGTWMRTLGSDMPFWSESFEGNNLPTCAACTCSGAGDRVASPDGRSPSHQSRARESGSEEDAPPRWSRERSSSRSRGHSPSPQSRSRAQEGDAPPRERSPSRQSYAQESRSASPHSHERSQHAYEISFFQD